MQNNIYTNTIKVIRNIEHEYGWQVMANPDSPEYGVNIFYYEPNTTQTPDNADSYMTFNVDEAEKIGKALIAIANEIKKKEV